MKNQLRTLGVAALVAQSLVFFACSSASTTTGTGGTTGGGTGGTTVTGGGGLTTTAAGGSTGTTPLCLDHPGSCTCTADNPDSVTGGACAAGCQSSSCTTACTQDCCVSCGIDQAGLKTCLCPSPGFPYTNCNCAPPAGFPVGATGGFCSPQGYAATAPPTGAPVGSISLKGLPCTKINTVCFTADSVMTSERGCICMADGVMHCGSVNHWFMNTNAPATPYN